VFGMLYPQNCLGQTNAAAGANATLKMVNRVATNPRRAERDDVPRGQLRDDFSAGSG
jgi:hypothetical protein